MKIIKVGWEILMRHISKANYLMGSISYLSNSPAQI